MKKKVSCLVMLSTLIWQSCAMDYTTNAGIHNETGGDLDATVFYNKVFVDTAFHNRNYSNTDFLNYSTNRTGSRNYRVDSIALSASFTLKNGEQLEVIHIPGGRDAPPLYDEIDSVRLRSKTTRLTVARDKLPSMFLKEKQGWWVWTVR